ncbi:unnamed protein product, partial [Ilex paraguariensis]
IIFAILIPSVTNLKAQEANWSSIRKKKAAEAVLYQREKEAEAQKAIAEAAFYARQQVAEGELYAMKKEAEGIMVLAQAQGIYIRTLMDTLGGNHVALRDYLMINGERFRKSQRSTPMLCMDCSQKLAFGRREVRQPVVVGVLP